MRKGKRVLMLAHGLRALLIAQALLSGGALALDPPSPTPPEPGNPQQGSTTEAASSANNDKRGTDDSPLSIKLLNTGKSPDEAEHEAENEEAKASREWWLAIATAVASGATVVLVCVTAFLAWFTYKLWRATSQASERQAVNMRESLDIIKQSADAAKTSADTGREQFIAAHRPKVIVRRASHAVVDGQDGVQYVVTNTGDTVATIVEISTRLWRELGGEIGDPGWKRYRTIPDYNPSVPVSIRINSGEHVTEVDCKQGQVFSQFNFPPGDLDTPEPKPDPTTGKDLLFFGYVVYEDGVRRKRTTAFCRRYVKLTKRFVPIDDKDYEYQD